MEVLVSILVVEGETFVISFSRPRHILQCYITIHVIQLLLHALKKQLNSENDVTLVEKRDVCAGFRRDLDLCGSRHSCVSPLKMTTAFFVRLLHHILAVSLLER
jgi:hypothetical protein